MSKELDMMSGLNSYDYGARQYYSVVSAWDRVDSLCEKYYNISPYAYCAGNHSLSFDAETNIITLNYNCTALFGHEATHASQFERGDLAFDRKTSQSLGQDLFDEVETYKAQWSFSPWTTSGISSSKQITPNWVQNIIDSNTKTQPYKAAGISNTGVSPVNVNSSKSELFNAYPWKSQLQMLPQDFILKNLPTIYMK